MTNKEKAVKETGERIKKRYKDMQLTQKEIVTFTGAGSSTVCLWANGKSLPQSRYIVKLAELLKTTPQWILTGEDDSPDHITDVFVDTKAIGNRLQEKMWDEKINHSMVARALSLKSSKVHHWVKGRALPKDDLLEQVAELLNTTPDWIMTGKIKKSEDTHKKVGSYVSCQQIKPLSYDEQDNLQDNLQDPLDDTQEKQQHPLDNTQEQLLSMATDLIKKVHKQGYEEGYAQAKADIQALWSNQQHLH